MNSLEEETDSGSNSIPLIPKENHMNDGDHERFLKYLDPEFLEAVPDEHAIDMDLIALKFKEKLNLSLDENDTEVKHLSAQDRPTAMPREYQFELFQKAVKENTIAVLGTGAGKTLISVMLMKHMSMIEREQRLVRRNTKLSFFLVSLVPLIFQQATVIKTNCDIKLQEICGSMNVDSWTKKQWEPIFEENDACVMTAQVFLNALRHGYIKLSQVNLIIFDECHHALKKHPYNLIMREFYDRCPIDSKPKIFGMTASPVVNNVNMITSVTTLEKHLDCLAYTATNTKELDMVLHRPQEYILTYEPPQLYFDSSHVQKIREKFSGQKRFHSFLKKMNETLLHLGPWCCDKRCSTILSDLNQKTSLDDLQGDLMVEEELEIKGALDICKDILTGRDPDTSDRARFSPKVHRLITSLKCESQHQNFCAIIFVEHRETALALHELIESIDDLSHVKSAVMTGHGSTEEGDISMTYTRQNKIIQGFRENEINLMIATNVAEEGLDIQPCNYVYRFDQPRNLISYIQSRGRARSQDSKYILFSENTKTGLPSVLADLKQQEEELKNFCNALPSERNVANKFSYDSTDNLSSVEDSDDDDYLEGALYIPETDAVITIQSAIPLLHRYCLALPADDYFHPRPVFEFDSYDTGYSCCLRLPSNTPFNVLRSHIASSKSRAKALVSLEACKKLRSLNCLDKHLKPFDYRTEILGDMAPETDSNGMVIGSKRRHNMYEKRTPQLWERHEDIDDEVIQVEDDADLLKARKNKDVENLEINKQINPVEKSDDPFEVLLATDETLNLDTPTPHFDPDGDLIMFDDDETITESTRDNAADESFCYWASIVEIMTQDDKINELPYRQLCILTRKPMPALPQICLFDRSKPIHVTIHAINIGITLEQERLSHLCRYMLNVMKSLLNKEFTCDPKDTPYFTVPLVHGNINQSYQTLTKDDLEKLIDWVEIDSIVQLKKEEFTLDSEESLDDVILIDYSNSERRYRFEKIHHDLNLTSPVPTDHTVRESGYTSFQDYYTQKDRKIPVNIDNPMVLGRQVKRRLNYITTSSLVESKIKGGAYGWLAPEFCKKYHMHLSVFQALLVVPSIMIRIDSLLLLNEAKTKFDLHIDDQLMLEAYTTASACMEMNYERLEILGDSILKFLSTISLYVNFPFQDEGRLHHMRIRIVCNKALYRAAKRLKFYRYITSHNFNTHLWRPVHFHSQVDNVETMEYLHYHILSDKMLADIVESSLGASYLSGGLECALHTAIQMQIPLDNITCWSDIVPIYKNARREASPRVEASALKNVDMQKIKEIVDHDFKNPLLVVEALTHASLMDSQVPCYQRLEFLGDAVLDFLVVRYLYSKYTKADPGKIAELKDACVNNCILGMICLELNLHKHIIHYSGRIIQDIRDYAIQMEELKNSETGEYWRELGMPKVLSDVVESMLGAVFVDSGFDLKPIEVLFDKWFLGIFEKHITPETIVSHPTSQLMHLFQNFGCEGFKIRNVTSDGEGAHTQKAVIFLHDRALANGSDSNVKMARRYAAAKALERLKEEPSILNDVCNCRISLMKRGISTEEMDVDDDED